MRYLNKVIFINAAKIEYAELAINGNVHFVGTQGVGKSTLLRAILFFYNADTQGLGISVASGKQNFAEYYFPFDNSFIVYEVNNGNNAFCILAFKVGNKVSFRFIASAYNKAYFVVNDKPISGWEILSAALDKAGIFYTKRKIEEYKEYRDILYGNLENKRSELKQFALMETKEYQYVYKTIQNVFLNSKMDAEFIKQTIIMSLGNDVDIKLNTYNHHLQDFDIQFEDLKKHTLPHVEKKANDIITNFNNIQYFKNQLVDKYNELNKAIAFNTQEIPRIASSLQIANGQIEQEEKNIEKIKRLFDDKIKSNNDSLSILNNNIKIAKEKSAYYEKNDIQQIITKSNEKPNLILQQKALQQEKTILLTAFQEQEQKYAMLLQNIIYKFNETKNAIETNIVSIEKSIFLEKEQLAKKHEFNKNALQLSHKHNASEYQKSVDIQNAELNNITIEKAKATHRIWFKEEIEKIVREITTTEKIKFDAQISKKTAEQELEFYIQKGNNERDAADEKYKAELQLILNKIAAQQIELNNLQETVKGYDATFLHWLENNYPNYQDNIGKIVDEKTVLLNANLNPTLIEKAQSLFGIAINTNELPSKTFSFKKYSAALDQENIALVDLQKIKSNLEKQKVNADENLKQKTHKKLAELKLIINKQDSIERQSNDQLQQLNASLFEWKEKAIIEQKTKIKELNIAILNVQETLKQMHNNRDVAIVQEDKATKKLEKELNDQYKIIDEKNQQEIADYRAKLSEAIIIKENAELDLETEKKNELHTKGADTIKIDSITASLNQIKIELDLIEKNAEFIFAFKKDKEEYFDKLDTFKKEKASIELLIETLTNDNEIKLNEVKSKLIYWRKEKSGLEDIVRKIELDKTEYAEFMETVCWQYVTLLDPVISGQNTSYTSAIVLIKELTQLFNSKYNVQKDELKKNTISYIGHFSTNNIFNFKLQGTEDEDYIAFATMLQEFIANNKIHTIQQEVASRFASIINTISNDASTLLKASGKVQDVITKINKDFKQTDFVSAIKNIELKIDETKNEIVKILNAINIFYNEHGTELGTANLFSSSNQLEKNNEAVALLKRFVAKIKDSKRDSITLSDAFELRFKIQENDNDTGWQEKLSNVGSEGTDILVKALLNIMLLNVFKQSASKSFKDFNLHCMMDEIGKLHPTNVRGIIKFANDRNIFFINGSPYENDALAFNHIYKLSKTGGATRVVKLITKAN